MSWKRVVLVGGILIGAGWLIGLFFSQPESHNLDGSVQRSLPIQRLDRSPPGKLVDFAQMPTEIASVEHMPSLPEGAIEGEKVMHFSSRRDYREYLKALASVGAEPLGQIDELLVVRVASDALGVPQPEQYGARFSYAYRVQRPPSPVEVAPEVYARLQSFGQSARAIVGGAVAGDGAGVMVGLLDSGIQAHPQFDDVSIVHINLVGDGVDGPGAAHGTAVASIIAGSGGIAPAAELLVVRVLDDQGLGNSFDVAAGIVRAVERGVQVLNLSLGVYQDTQLLREAVRYAHAHNVIMVAAAGNDAYTQMPYPAAYPEVLSVTAVDRLGNHARFPNQSAQIDFAAPGVGVSAANGDQGAVLFSGTSAAAPFVSGTLASMLSSGEAQTGTQAVDLIKRHLDDAGAPGVDPVYGGGLLNWDRLRERNIAAVHDVALADVYLSPETLPGTTVPVQVTVQNRGTSWLLESTLSVQVGVADPVDFTIGTLGPGRTTTRQVFTQVPPYEAAEGLRVAAQVLPEGSIEDVRLENNVKAVRFRPAQP
jgi:subtilisin family serine protease